MVFRLVPWLLVVAAFACRGYAWPSIDDPDLDVAWSTIADVGAGEQARDRAARVVLAHAENAENRAKIETELGAPPESGTVARCLLDAMAEQATLSPRLFPVLAQRIAAADAKWRAAYLPAFAPFRTRDAARILLLHAGSDQPPEVSGAAFAALAELSGKSDLGTDLASWTQWLSDCEQLSESQWRLSLADAHAARAGALAAELDRRDARLTASLRRLHLALPPDERRAYVRELMGDEVASVRIVGLELADRELAAGGQLDERVGESAVALLVDDDPSVRARAASLVRRLAPPSAAGAIWQALEKEDDPRAASALLLAAARWPRPAAFEATLAWLRSGSVASDGAAEAALAFYRAGVFASRQQEAALDALRALPDDHMNQASITLLALLGDEQDLQRIARVLRSSSGALKRPAAEALGPYADFLDDVLGAAAGDATLFEIACRAVLLTEPTASRFRQLMRLPMPAPEDSLDAMMRVAEVMPSSELWAAIRGSANPVLTKELLLILTDDDRELSESMDPNNLAAIASGTMELAEIQLNAGDAGGAASTLEHSPFVPSESREARTPPPGFECLRGAALVALGRVSEARNANVPFACWARGLEASLNAPFAPKVLAAFEETFGAGATPEQRATLEALRSRIALAGDGERAPTPR